MMLRHNPSGPLAGPVKCFWYSERLVVDHRRERALPTGAMTLVIHLGGDPVRIFRNEVDAVGQTFRESVVWGPQSSYVVMDTSRKGAVVGVQFRPSGARSFFAAPAHELTDRHISLEDLWGGQARHLGDQLMHAPSPEVKFALLEELLTARLRRPLLLHPAVAYALRELSVGPAVARIGAIQRETGYSPKRFIELFADSIGLTPKLYSRIQRFQRVLWSVSHGLPVEWAEIALDCGYCDQPHLNRDFRSFSGVTPVAYRPVSKERPHHVAIGA